MSTDKGLRAVSRSISEDERHLILWLIDHGEANDKHFSDQVEALIVNSSCICGCPTVYFALPDGDSRRGERIISDHAGKVDEMDVGVMLFEVRGHLSSLEVYSMPGSDKPFGLPDTAILHRF